MRISPERQLALQVADYLKYQFPGIIYRFDLAADMKLTMGQTIHHKRLHPKRGFPDLTIFAARDGYNCLMLELKREGAKVFKSNGELYADPHLAEQDAMHQELRRAGCKVEFAIGLDQARLIIYNYLNQQSSERG